MLEKFSQTIAQSTKDTIPVPIHAPYHATHLFTKHDVDEVIRTARPTFSSRSIIPAISGASGEVREPLTFTALLRCCVEDMLILQLDIPKISRAVARVLDSSFSAQVVLKPIETSISNGILASLEPAVAQRCSVDNTITPAASMHRSVTEEPSNTACGTHDSKIAIVSMSGRFPDAANLEEFWDLLYEGRDVHRQIPEDRFDAERHHDATGRRKNTSKVMNGCWIKEPGLFDAKFFNISPKEAEQSDPGQRLALETAYEALEMAGIVPDRTPSTQRDRVGVFYGMTSDDWREINSGQNVDTYFIPGTVFTTVGIE